MSKQEEPCSTCPDEDFLKIVCERLPKEGRSFCDDLSKEVINGKTSPEEFGKKMAEKFTPMGVDNKSMDKIVNDSLQENVQRRNQK